MTERSGNWVLQLCHGYSPPFDDVARQWRTLFDGTDYRVLTVFLTGKPDKRIETLVGGEVAFLGFKSKDLRGLKIRQIRAVKALHQKFQFRFAVAHRYKSIYIASHLPEIKVIGVSHAYGVYDRFLRKRYVKKKADRLLLAGVSDAIRDDARRALPGFPASRIQTVYNHIDVEKVRANLFSREEARQMLGLTNKDFVVGNVGRLHPDKDQATLINAFVRALPDMPEARLVILGEGRLRPALEEQITELGVAEKVELKGRVPEAYRYFRAFDVFVLSSDYEPFGMVLLEAMAAAIPVISSNCGGAPEVLGSAGLLFPVADVEALARALDSVHRSTQKERNVMGEALRNRLEKHFTDEAVRLVFWSRPFSKEFC
ncbi:MAG: glycosyltransferase [Porticoccaceae bacterium]